MSIGRIKFMISYDKLWQTMKEKGVTQYTLIIYKTGDYKTGDGSLSCEV